MSVGTTRISGRAGVDMHIVHYLAGDLSEEQERVVLTAGNWYYGTGTRAVNVVYADSTTLADAATAALDLYASGTLLDVFNRDLTMEALKFLYVKNNSADATLHVGGGASNDLDIWKSTSDQQNIPPGGDAILWNDPSAAGLDITTNPKLYIEHDGTGTNTMQVDVIAMGLDSNGI